MPLIILAIGTLKYLLQKKKLHKIFSVGFKNIESVPFPAVTVCAPDSRKWTNLVKALVHFDKDGAIFDFLKHQQPTSPLFSLIFEAFSNNVKRNFILGELEGKPILNHDLTTKLDLLPFEKDIFYLLHYACYALESSCGQEMMIDGSNITHIAFDSILAGETRQQTAERLKSEICQRTDIDCSVMDRPFWTNCTDESISSSVYQNWCKDCFELTGCLQPRTLYTTDNRFIGQVMKIFQGWRKYFTREDLVHATLMTLLGETYYRRLNNPSRFRKLDEQFMMYIQKIRPFPNSNLTVMDLWMYTNSRRVFSNDKASFMANLDNIPTEALRKCLQIFKKFNDKVNCTLVEEYFKEILDQKDLWNNIFQDPFQDFIPLCSYGMPNNSLEKCTDFKRMTDTFDQEECFTFDEYINPTLGATQGLNFLINYAYPGTNKELSKAVTITLHEPGKYPDVKNIKGKTFYILPGQELHMTFSATEINSTKAFDQLDPVTKQCQSQPKYDEIGCIRDQIVRAALETSICLPWYMDGTNNGFCNYIGTMKYKDSIEKGISNKTLQEFCYHSCHRIKYSLHGKENLPINNTIMEVESYGSEFKEYFLGPKNLYDYFDKFENEIAFMAAKMKRTSLIHINFEESEVMTLTKDAKITLPDMIGSIGGTLGVFIGFSFLGLLDTLVELFQYLKAKLQNVAP